MLFALLGLHALLAVAAPLIARRLGRGVFLACALAPAGSTAYAAVAAPAVLAGTELRDTLAWAPGLGVSGDLRLDAFGLVMVALVSGIGTLVFAYAYAYFPEPRPDLGTFSAVLTAFAGSMLGLVLADNLLFLFVFWELTSITSYLLIGFEDRKAEARDAALQALLTTGLGGLALLGGLVMIGQTAGTYSLSAVLASPPPASGVLTAGLVLCLLGAFTKSAQVPFHTWLPGAMAAPTPVSAYLHSATMVKAGVYLVARFAPAFAAVPVWRPLVVTVGAATMLVGGYRALRQHDLKLLLAFGTISQLGFLMVLFGWGTPELAFAGVALLLAHALFKAALFMVVGIVDHEAHTRDLRRLGGLHRALPGTMAAAVLAGASMAGLPPLFGFIAKEAALEGVLHEGTGVMAWMSLAGITVGSVLTVAYTARFLWGAFGPATAVDAVPPERVQAPSRAFLAPGGLLAVLGVVFGLFPKTVDAVVNHGTRALAPTWESSHLALWHGFNLALALSAVVVAAGLALFAARDPVERLQAHAPAWAAADDAYRQALRRLLQGAKRVTGLVQNGSLPVYLSVISLTLVLVPGTVLVTSTRLPALDTGSVDPVQCAVAVLVMAATIGAGVARRRFVALLFLGAVGYGVAVLFVVQGAPDLALTQFLIETLLVVIFVLVLRHLPARFTPQRLPVYGWLRGLVAAAVGVFVFAFALVALDARTQPSVSEEYLARAYTDAHGANVVNVILVDFRALDTLGEIVVLAVAGAGIASIVKVVRGARTRGEEEAGAHGEAASAAGPSPRRADGGVAE